MDENLLYLYGLAAVTAAIVTSTLLSLKKTKKTRRKRSMWRRPLFRRRAELGATNMLLSELRSSAADENSNPYSFKNYMRMDESTYNELFAMIQPQITSSSYFRKPISVAEKLAVTLRFLATGESLKSLSYQFRISQPALSFIIPEVCEAIFRTLQPTYMKVPTTEADWKSIAREFEQRWNFPHCVGSLDGKHIVIQKPRNTGSTFYTYKHTFALQLLAVVDGDYKFIYVDVGCQGRIGDAGVYQNSSLCAALESNSINIPQPEPLISDSVTSFPYVLVADEAFPLKPYIMKPYAHRGLNASERIFNYRLSRARRIVENAFGILASRFRVFRTPINLRPDKVEQVVLAATVLHNFLRQHCAAVYTPVTAIDVENLDNGTITQADWHAEGRPTGLSDCLPACPGRPNLDAKTVRSKYAHYFEHEGQVPWQWNIITR